MFKAIATSLFLIAVGTSLAFGNSIAKPKGEEKPNQQEPNGESEIDIGKVSKAFGHLIGKNLQSLGVEFDVKDMVQGISDGIAGKLSQMDEAECMEAVSTVRERAFRKLADKNLDQANTFLIENIEKQGVLELEKSKLQYRIEKTGSGTVVEKHHSPMIRYTGKFINGEIFGASQEDELISLQETIPGFTKGIVGMREGEKRTIFIHPELGYGSTGHLPPNSLLIFDIEVIKANGAPDQDIAPNSVQPHVQDVDEIVDHTNREKAMR